MASMNLTEFSGQLYRLEQEFMIAGKKFSQEKATIFYQEFRYCTLDHIKQAVNYMIGNLRYSPTLEDFKKAIEATKTGNVGDSNRFQEECKYCDGKGLVACIDYSQRGTRHFPDNSFAQVKMVCDCGCEAAQLLGKNFMKISDAQRDRYRKYDYERNNLHLL